ncbi:low molecular weight protein-tyrosine-phosphatase [Myceligenerans crystallogenes]|uniref:protein-tyrosine-phosphatase n=1 Tax=Myceligenerans crystallogenes TaxID=316335 RepID=A0ABN2N719_9MICO
MTYRVMITCTGNICRSPMAEIVLRDRLDAAGLDAVVDSTGVSDEEAGNPIDPRASAALVRRGYAAGDAHVARHAIASDVAARGLVLAMTNQHARRLRDLAPGADVRLYRTFDPAAYDLGDHALDVADPWYGGPADFEICLDEIEAAADGVVAHVKAALAS